MKRFLWIALYFCAIAGADEKPEEAESQAKPSQTHSGNLGKIPPRASDELPAAPPPALREERAQTITFPQRKWEPAWMRR